MAVFVTLFVAAALVVGGSAMANTPHLLVVSVPRGQTLQDLAKGRFVEKVTCRRACYATAQVLIPENFIKPKSPPNKLVVIGSAKGHVRPGQTATFTIRLNKTGKSALKSIGSVSLFGRVGAVSTSNAADTGSSSWERLLRRT